MDALSDVLAMLRIQSTISSRFEGRGRWALKFPGHGSQIKFGSVLDGSLNMQVQGTRKPVTFNAGDCYLLTNNRPFTISSIPAGIVQEGPAAFRAARGADNVVRIGEGGDPAMRVSLASGVFSLDGEASQLLLKYLPPLVQLRADNPAKDALHSLLQLLRAEDDPARAGALVAQSSLATLLLVQALRIYLATMPQPQGWLGAMADRRVGAALSAMHAELARPWTVEVLAGEAGMSRTAFSLRFKALVGVPPLDYLTRWRMTVARDLLGHGNHQVAAIAEQVGYQSDTAFSAAFKRVTGVSPAAFRKGARYMPHVANAP